MKNKVRIKRFKKNPIIVPADIPWLCKNAYNCGVVFDKGEYLFKMLFRAADREDLNISDLGLAISSDGVSWNMHEKPVLKSGFNSLCSMGVEDPRIVKWIDGYYYIFATAFSSLEERIGIWRTRNFFEYEWAGTPFSIKDRNASIFPELIGDWAYLLHRRFPNIWISRTKDMALKGGWQDGQTLVKKDRFYKHPEKLVLPERVGMAGPPVRTPKGWLVITHVAHRWDQDGTKHALYHHREYSLGYMVLDLKNPRKVLYIHPEPILRPEESYEIFGRFPKVIFSCATVDFGDDILIYYGGADTVICGGRLEKEKIIIHNEKLYY